MLRQGRESFMKLSSNFVKRKSDEVDESFEEQNLYKRDLKIINQKLEQIAHGVIDDNMSIYSLVERIGHD